MDTISKQYQEGSGYGTADRTTYSSPHNSTYNRAYGNRTYGSRT
ncbi:hypothetical protein AB0J38_00420 [Streptomyces sp. NPDC050095]